MMFRLLGFLIGSLTSIFIILLIIGMPTLTLDDEKESQARYDAAIEMLRAKQQEIESTIETITEPAEPVEPVETVEAEPVIPAAIPEGPPTDDPQWYSFWNPFRSEIAARGFVSRLESVTGMDYRVVKVKAGVYEVAFAYDDDDERRSKLAQISTATGLDLPES